MEIFQLLYKISNALFIALSVLYLPFGVFSVVGLIAGKKYSEREEKLKYGIIIPARNEETVIGNIIRSIRQCDYPQDKLDIFVIAHNCTDNTEKEARELGAIVYRYDNANERTMGYAIRRLFRCIEDDFGTQNYDGFFIFNADNTFDKKYFTEMNNAFLYYDRKHIITSRRISGNWNEGLLPSLYGMYFLLSCILECRGRTILGCSTRVTGTGYVFSSEIVKHGWEYVSITEDWELTSDVLMKNNKISYCDDAVFYDEQPNDIVTMWRQRLRWQLGHLIVFKERFSGIISGLFTKKRPFDLKYSLFDFSCNLIPYSTVCTLLYILKYIIILAAVGCGASFLVPADVIGQSVLFFVLSYTALSAGVLFMVALQKKRLPKINPILLVFSSIIFPLFLLIVFPMEWIAFFIKKPVWTPISHSGMNQSSENK